MRRLFAILSLFGLLAACGDPAGRDRAERSPPVPTDDVASATRAGDPVLVQSLADIAADVRSATGVPAVGLAIVTRRDGLLAATVAGDRVAGANASVAIDDPWHIGSDTKAITAAIFAREVERGTVSWGSSVDQLAPRLADGMHPDWRHVVIEDFFAHTSGLGDIARSFLLTARTSPLSPAEQRLELLRDRLADPPDADRSYAYSNMNYMLAGAVLEEVTGRDWEVLATEFMEDLGAQPGSFGFGPPQGDAPQGHRGDPPRSVGQGILADNPRALGPAGTMHVSLEGWSRFIRLFLTDGGDLLSRESITKLTAVWPATGEDRYAMGWGVSGTAPAVTLHHAGSNTMWFAKAVVLPAEGIAVLVVTNHGGDAGREATISLTRRGLAAARATLVD
jgi:D-alanyl-D-alanine carboxypeptidase